MPIETAVVAAAPTARPLSDIRLRRILRFTIAVTLATAYACYINWTFSFLLIALVVAMMALPTPAPSLGFAVRTVIMLLLLQGLGLLLMLPLLNHQVAGLALVLLLLFLYFQFQAQGKSAPSNATFVVVCFTLTAAFGAISLDAGVAWAKGLSKSVLALFPIIWIAFALLPQGTFAAAPKPPPVEGGPVRQAIVALRPVVMLIPLMIFMLGSENSIRYLTGYYQAAVISQHPARATSRALAIDLVLATVYGCTAGLAMCWLIMLWPSLLWVVLLMAIFSFIFASRIFPPGPQPLSPHFVRWYYSMITLVLIVFPEAMSQGFTGDDADMKVVERVLDYLFITAYSAFAVLLYDAIVDRLSALHRRFARSAK